MDARPESWVYQENLVGGTEGRALHALARQQEETRESVRQELAGEKHCAFDVVSELVVESSPIARV